MLTKEENCDGRGYHKIQFFELPKENRPLGTKPKSMAKNACKCVQLESKNWL